jgi:Fungal specific transcription factor domain
VRCDRAEPSCGWCARHGRQCVYRARQKPGFRAGYVRELETKVNRLEAMLHTLGRRVEDHFSVQDYTQEPTGPSEPTPGTKTQLADCKNSERIRPTRASEMMSVQSLMNSSRLTETAESPSDLPAGELLYNLVDLYFKHVNTWCPILDRKVTVDGFFGSSIPDDADRIVLYAIVATTLRFSQDSSLTPEYRKRCHSAARDKVLLHSLQNPSIKSLQALVILAWDFLGSSDGLPSVNIIAMMVRTVLQLNLQVESGLSQSPAVRENVPLGPLHDSILPPPASWIEEEGRRRLFWMIYIIERYSTVATTADFVLNETEIDRYLPTRYDLFSQNRPVETRYSRGPGRSRMIIDQPENLGSFSYHCEVMRSLSRVQMFLQTPVDICSLAEVERWQNTYRELDDELNAWLSNLPDDYSRVSQLCHSDPTSKISNWINLHAAFVTSVVRLHSCAAYPTVRSHIFTPSFYASQRCLSAVQSLREIAQDVINTAMLNLLGPHFAFSLYVAARLLLVHAACTGAEPDPNCEFFISILNQMGQYWNISRQYAQLLDRICKRSRMEWPLNNAMILSTPKALAMMRRYVCPTYLSIFTMTN